MRLISRLFVSLVAGLVTFYFVLWPLAAILSGVAGGGQAAARKIGIVAALLALMGAGAMVRYVWRETGSPILSEESRGQGRFILRGAVIVGLIGFAAGFFGPLVFTPDANQGPLLGILFTGPLGVLVGAIGGAVLWRLRRKQRSQG